MIDFDAIVALWRVEAPQSLRPWSRILALAITSACIWAPEIRAVDYWVGRNGRDATGQGSQDRPWATLQHAADRVRSGDTVHVLDGDYVGFDLRRGGTPQAPVAFKAEGKRVRIARRNDRTPDGINVEGADHVVIEDFVVNGMPRAGVRAVFGSHVTIRGIRASNNGSWGIFTAHCDDVAIIGNQASGSVKEHGIYVSNSGDRPWVAANVIWGNRGCGIHMNGDKSQGGDGIISGALVENNVISENGRSGGSGINCDGVQGSKFRNNLLYDNHGSGLSLYRIDGGDGSRGNAVINNTIVQAADGRWAVNVTDMSTNNVIANNILLHKGSKGSINVSADSLAGMRSDHNLVVDRFSPDDARFVSLSEWQKATGLDHHSRVSRLSGVFVDLQASDYHLCAKSPAIDVGAPALAPRSDLAGRARPAGAGPDIGAYEF
jgi:hypothetical protein